MRSLFARDAETAQGAPEAPGAAQGASGALREPTLFLLDEFAALGRLEAVERAMGLMAGYGLQLWPILQDLSQLRALYGARANTFVANAGVLQCFGVNDYETAKALGQLMGQATTHYATTSHRPGDRGAVRSARRMPARPAGGRPDARAGNRRRTRGPSGP